MPAAFRCHLKLQSNLLVMQHGVQLICKLFSQCWCGRACRCATVA